MKISNECKIWVRRLFTYLALFLAVIFISRIVFLNFDILHTDVDSARYMLSALIQSEAAIIAIVITMSLIAAQLAASSYSVRVINIFRNAPDLWILMSIYGIVLFWGLGVLKLIEKADPQCASNLICQSNLQGHIAITYSLGIFAFVALVPYMRNTMEMLTPSMLTRILAANITKEYILKSQGKSIVDDDPSLPIIDILYTSLIKYDHGTFKTGLNAIEKQFIFLLCNYDLISGEERYLSHYIFTHLIPVGKLALRKNDDYSIIDVVIAIQNIGGAAAENKLERVTFDAIDNLRYIGREAVNQNLKWPADVAIRAIEKIGKISIEKELKTTYTIEGGWLEVSCLEEIGTKAIENRLESAAQQVVDSLGLIGMAAAEHKRSSTILKAISSLEMIGMSAMDKGLDEVMETTSISLNWISGKIPPEFDSECREAMRVFEKINAAIEAASNSSKNDENSPENN